MKRFFTRLIAIVAMFGVLGLNTMPLVAFAQDKPAADMKADAKGAEKKEEAKAPPPPVPNKGDVAWMLTCTALVLMMSVPALALFYGGMVRAKNMLSVLM
jgi:Amt family ammonium transporter